jgi:excisionase family DNA binding protein
MRGHLAMSNEADNVLTIEELARYLKLSKSTLYKLCQDGEVPGRKVGRHWRFSKVVIDDWIGRTSIPREVRPRRP